MVLLTGFGFWYVMNQILNWLGIKLGEEK